MSVPINKIQKALVKTSFGEANRQLHTDIRSFNNDGIDKLLNSDLFDVNYTDEEFTLPIIDAIIFQNEYAFNKILKHPKFDIHALSSTKVDAIYSAIGSGNEAFVKALLAKGSDINSFCGRSLIDVAVTTIKSPSVVQHGVKWFSGFRLISEDISGVPHEPTLKAELEDFYLQKGAYYTRDKLSPVQFDLKDRALNVLYNGNLAILGLLLNKGVNPHIQGEGDMPSPFEVLENPGKHFLHFDGPKEENVDFHAFNDEAERDTPTFTMQFWNRPRTASVKIRIYYNLIPARKLVESVSQHLSNGKSLAEGLDSKVSDQLRMQEQTVATRLNHVHSALQANSQQVQNLNVSVQQTQQQMNFMYCDLASKDQYNKSRIELLQIETQGAIQNSKEKEIWQRRKQAIENNELSLIFCLALNQGLRKAVKQGEANAAYNIHDTAISERILTGAIKMLGQVTTFIPFASALFSVPELASQSYKDFKHEKLQEAIRKLFVFKSSDEVCDKTSILAAEYLMTLSNGHLFADQKDAENMAKKTLALLLFAMMEKNTIDRSQPLEGQLANFLIESEVFKKRLNEFKQLQIQEDSFSPSVASSTVAYTPESSNSKHNGNNSPSTSSKSKSQNELSPIPLTPSFNLKQDQSNKITSHQNEGELPANKACCAIQ